MIGCTTYRLPLTLNQLQQKLGTQFNGRRLWPLHVGLRCRCKTLTFAISSSDELLLPFIAVGKTGYPYYYTDRPRTPKYRRTHISELDMTWRLSTFGLLQRDELLTTSPLCYRTFPIGASSLPAGHVAYVKCTIIPHSGDSRLQLQHMNFTI